MENPSADALAFSVPDLNEQPDLHGQTVWVVDTLSRIYQLFHALPEMTSPQGVPVSAVFGFARDLLDIIEKKKADFIFCAIDAPGPTFRHNQFAAYKATRADMPADLVPQIPLVRLLIDVMGIPRLELPGFEADDILATLATCTVLGGGNCIIATSDKDARQLICPQVRLLNLRTNTMFGAEELLATWGIRPDQVVDFLAIVGDAVDNVPGVPGIGPKTASELLRTYDTLDILLQNIPLVSGTKRKENLQKFADTARFSRELVRLVTSVPVEIPWQVARRHPPDTDSLADFLREMGFHSLLTKVLGSAAKRDAPRPPSPAPASAQLPTPPSPKLKKKQDNGQAMLFASDDAAVVRPRGLAGLTPLSSIVGGAAQDAKQPAIDSNLAEFFRTVTAADSLALCVVKNPTGTILSPPMGMAMAAGSTCIWVEPEWLTSDRVKQVLEDQSIKKLGHDLKRQAVALRVIGIELAGGSLDTLLAAYLLDAGQRQQSLAEIASRYGLPAAPLSLQAEPAGPAQQAVQDCQAVQQLSTILADLLRQEGLLKLYEDLEMPLARVLAEMEFRGVRIDCDILTTLSAEYALRLASLECEIHALAGHPFAIASRLQVQGVLFDELHLPVVKRTKTGPSTDAEVLEALAALHPLPAKLLEHRKYFKLKSTYVDALPLLVEPLTGRIHTSFNQTLTATGRLSSSDPNLQNIPIRTADGQQIRAAFLPREPGWQFVSADYSQIELRVLAHLSHDAAMCAAFSAGEDIHTRTAAAVFGMPDDAVTADMRRAAKAVNFGILYGQSGFGLAKSLGILPADATAFIEAYFKTFAGAAAFMDEVLDHCRQEGSVTTIQGRRRSISGVRDYLGRRNKSGSFALSLAERTAINTVVQGSAADLMKLAMLAVDRRLGAAGLKAGIVLQIHDELLLDCPASETAVVAKLLVEEMRGAMVLDVPLEVSVHTGSNWAEA